MGRGEEMEPQDYLYRPKKRLSLQYHHHREEWWLLVEGEAEATTGQGKDSKTIELKKVKSSASGSGRSTGFHRRRGASSSRWRTGISMRPISSVSRTTTDDIERVKRASLARAHPCLEARKPARFTAVDMWWYGRVHREQAIVALIVAVVVIARVASFAYFSSACRGES